MRRLALSPRSHLDGAWACAAYRSAAGTLLRKLKYKGKRSVLRHVETLLRAGEEKLPASIFDVDFVMPVPLHEKKERARGFNQVACAFRPWIESKGLPFTESLRRVQETPPLHGRSASERVAVLRSAFAVFAADAALMDNKRILLLDDILTTGATLEEAAKCVRMAGAKTVYALVIASDHD